MKFWDVFGNFPGLGNVAFIIKVRVQLLRDIGPALSPFNSFLFLQGLETLPLRQRQHSANALEIARFLQTHALVDWVTYPGLPEDPSYANAARYLKRGFGGIVGFGIKGGLEAARKFINSVKLLDQDAVEVGDGRKAVGNHNHRLSFHHLVETNLNSLLGDGIKARGGLIQAQDRGVLSITRAMAIR